MMHPLDLRASLDAGAVYCCIIIIFNVNAKDISASQLSVRSRLDTGHPLTLIQVNRRFHCMHCITINRLMNKNGCFSRQPDTPLHRPEATHKSFKSLNFGNPIEKSGVV